MPSIKEKQKYLFIVNSNFRTNLLGKIFSQNEQIGSVGDWDLTVYRDIKTYPRMEFDALLKEGVGITTQMPVYNLSTMFRLMATFFKDANGKEIDAQQTEFASIFGPLRDFLVLRHDGNCTKVTCEDEEFYYCFEYWTS